MVKVKVKTPFFFVIKTPCRRTVEEYRPVWISLFKVYKHNL